MIVVKNVRNTVTKEVGDLEVVAYRYNPEARRDRGNDNRGIVVFFNGKYVKSIILTGVESNLLTLHNANIVRDLSYILSVSGSTLEIIDLVSHSTGSLPQDGGYSTSTIGMYSFGLDDYVIEVVESYLSRFKCWGLQLAIIQALNNYHERNYLVGREIHTPSTVYDFTKKYIEPIKPMTYSRLLDYVARHVNKSRYSGDWLDPTHSIRNLSVSECFDTGADSSVRWGSIASSHAISRVLEDHPGIELF